MGENMDYYLFSSVERKKRRNNFGLGCDDEQEKSKSEIWKEKK
jgi:hypothetical protein